MMTAGEIRKLLANHEDDVQILAFGPEGEDTVWTLEPHLAENEDGDLAVVLKQAQHSNNAQGPRGSADAGLVKEKCSGCQKAANSFSEHVDVEDEEEMTTEMKRAAQAVTRAREKLGPDATEEAIEDEAIRIMPEIPLETPDRKLISNENEFVGVVTCGMCMKEMREQKIEMSPRDYSRLSVGSTPVGLQVWCHRHDVNVLHIDFEGSQHPANMTAKKPT